MRKIMAAAERQGKPIGIPAPVEKEARAYLDMGAKFVAIGSDQGVFRAATQALRDKFL